MASTKVDACSITRKERKSIYSSILVNFIKEFPVTLLKNTLGVIIGRILDILGRPEKVNCKGL